MSALSSVEHAASAPSAATNSIALRAVVRQQSVSQVISVEGGIYEHRTKFKRATQHNLRQRDYVGGLLTSVDEDDDDVAWPFELAAVLLSSCFAVDSFAPFVCLMVALLVRRWRQRSSRCCVDRLITSVVVLSASS